MKYLITTISILFCSLLSDAAVPGNVEPVKIEPITKEAYSQTFYAEQAELWRQKTGENNQNAAAWLNYFQAARYANMLSDSLFKKYDLDAIVGSMPTSMANTFEFNYILYIHNNYNEGRLEHLLKAHELAPEREEAFHALVTYYTTIGDEVQAEYYSGKMFEAGEFSPSILAWNYNMLASVEKNAILLTHGDNDTYPAWVIQAVKKVNRDVKVLNVNLLMYDDYRKKVFEELDLNPVSTADYPAYQDMYLAIVRQFLKESKRPVYVATSVPEFIRKALGDSLYLVGLAFKYSPEPFDNLAFLKNNFENKFLKDHLHIQLEPDTGSNVVANMNMHYLPAMITLRQHYLDSGNSAKAKEFEPMIKQVASEAGKTANIAQYIGGAPDDNFISTISVKSLQKDMVKIREQLYAASTEVTNEQYEAFLMDLLKNKEYDLLEKCKAPKTDWRSLLPEKYHDLTDAQIFPNGHPDDPNAPIQNIGHEAAQEYCKWITKVYNKSTDKKKQYGEVEFRLPSEEEWEYAAHGNHTAPFPWGGYYFRNIKGCYLFNTEVADEKPCDDCQEKSNSTANDGSFFPVIADAYFPNDYGLYNTCGNVAEMIAVKGIAKGGSWEDRPDDSQIISQKKYSAPSPAIGFRVFMEVK